MRHISTLASLALLASLTSTAQAQEARWSSNLGAHLMTAPPSPPHDTDPSTSPADGADITLHAEAYWAELVRLDLAIVDAAAPCARGERDQCGEQVAPHLTARAALFGRAVPVWKAIAARAQPSPHREQARFYLASALLALGDEAEAATLLRELVRLRDASPYSSFAQARLADFFYQRAAPEVALPIYLSVASSDHGARPYGLYMAGWSHASQGQLPEAMQLFADAARALDARPHQIARGRLLDATLDALAQAYAEIGAPLKTHDFFRRFVSPEHTWTGALRVARRLAQIGRHRDADDVARIIIAGAPTGDPTRELARTLRNRLGAPP